MNAWKRIGENERSGCVHISVDIYIVKTNYIYFKSNTLKKKKKKIKKQLEATCSNYFFLSFIVSMCLEQSIIM